MLDADWIIEGQLLAMAAPWPEQAATLQRLGIGAIISLTERMPQGFPLAGVRHLHVPVRDFHPPTQEQLEEAQQFISDLFAESTAVAVHCAAGRGRTGTFVAAYLVTTGLSAAEAIRHVRRVRPGSVETPAQEAAIRQFASRCAAGAARDARRELS